MTKKEILKILKERGYHNLVLEADRIRKRYCDDKVYIRGLIEFSNYCVRNCYYCGLRAENRRIQRFRLKPAQVIKLAQRVIDKGFRTVILQSGDDFYYSADDICKIIKSIKQYAPNIALTLSIGERPLREYELFFNAGADRYLIKHETSNPKLYNRLHPRQSLSDRISIITRLQEIGYQIGIGSIIGLPGQSDEDIAQDLLFAKRVQPDMIGSGPFIPQADTPLGGHKSVSISKVIKVLALTRIILKNAHIPATTALATLNPKQGLFAGLKAGCNVIMVDCTPDIYRKKYIIYDNKARVGINTARTVINKANRLATLEKGDSLKNPFSG